MEEANNCKYCKKCKRDYPLSSFYNDKSTSDGKQRYCKFCMKEYQREGFNKYSKKTILNLLSRNDMTLEKVRLFYGLLI